MHYFLYLLPLIFGIILRLIVCCLLRNRKLWTTVQSNYVADTLMWHPDSPLGLKDLFVYLLEVLPADSPQCVSPLQKCPWLIGHLVQGHGCFLEQNVSKTSWYEPYHCLFPPTEGAIQFQRCLGSWWRPLLRLHYSPNSCLLSSLPPEGGLLLRLLSSKDSAHYSVSVHLNWFLEETSLEKQRISTF